MSGIVTMEQQQEVI